jgi:hypothetical protein
MSAAFEFTPARLKAWADMERRGVKLPEIARELGCGVHTLIRYKRRTGKINPVKAKAGKAGMAVRYGSLHGASDAHPHPRGVSP